MAMNLLAMCLSGDWRLPLDSFLGILQGPPDPGGPFGDALGWIVVFFVIIWPILRGILATARGNRDEHESQQGKATPPVANRERRRRTLEEILEGKLVTQDEEDAPAPPPRPRATVNRAPKASAVAPARFGERPTDEGFAPVYGIDDLYTHDRDKDLGKDPFDESSMELDLVPDARLSHVPTEDEVESGMGSSGTHARGTTRSSVAATTTSHGPGTAKGRSEPLLARDDPEVFFSRMKRPLSPWQKAFVLREVLSPPLASRPTPALTDLPD
ncbi:MAG: hypothetical protein ACJA2W_003702 [Planctomycetota bacterium]|jgi:hypothetical protein